MRSGTCLNNITTVIGIRPLAKSVSEEDPSLGCSESSGDVEDPVAFDIPLFCKWGCSV